MLGNWGDLQFTLGDWSDFYLVAYSYILVDPDNKDEPQQARP